MAKTKRKLTLDENVVAAHESLVDASQKVGKAATVLLRRIEELTAELQELEERYQKDLQAAQAKYHSDLAAAEKARERDVQALRVEKERMESELSARIATLESEKARAEEKLRKVQATLA